MPNDPEDILATAATLPERAALSGPESRRWRRVIKRAAQLASRCLLLNMRAKRSARRLDEILAMNPSAITTFDLDGNVVYANARAFDLVGVRTGARRGIDFDSTQWERRTLNGEPFPRDTTPFKRVLAANGGFTDWRYRLLVPGKPWRVVTSTAAPLRNSRGAITSVVVTTTDISARYAAEEETRTQRDTLEFVTSRIPGAVFLWRPDDDAPNGHYEYLSTRVRELFGLDPVSLLHHREAFSNVVEEDRERVVARIRECAEHRLPIDFEFRIRRGDGSVARVHALASPEQLPNGKWVWTGIYLDITDQARHEQDIRQAQKLEGLGHLAGGVAHDFNNLLTGIFGYLDLLEQNFETSELGARSDIGEIRTAAERAAWLTRQLLTFSRRQVVSTRDFDLNQVVTKTEKFLGRVLGDSVNLVVLPSDSPCHVHADPGQLEQVVLNLAVNARDAMPDGGSIIITTARELLAADEAAPELAPGYYVVMRVKDEGVGMSEEILGRIFEPYFTTKAPTRGTGIGLATVYGIVTQAKGTVRVCSKPGCGTTFSVYIPMAVNEPPIEEGPTDEKELKTVPCAGSILLVDDNDAVRLVTRRLLQHAGLTVVEARHAAEALAIVESREEPFAILATDLVMPGMSGKALAERMRERQPRLPVLFLSGFTSESVGEPVPGGPSHRFLAKPYTAAELISAITSLAGEAENVRELALR